MLNFPFTPASNAHAVQIMEKLAQSPCAKPFLLPVDPVRDGVPSYYQVITQPIDISLVIEKLLLNKYGYIDEWVRDMNLIRDNAKIFNGMKSYIYSLSLCLMTHFEQELKGFYKYDSRLWTQRYQKITSKLSDQMKRLPNTLTPGAPQKQQPPHHAPENHQAAPLHSSIEAPSTFHAQTEPARFGAHQARDQKVAAPTVKTPPAMPIKSSQILPPSISEPVVSQTPPTNSLPLPPPVKPEPPSLFGNIELPLTLPPTLPPVAPPQQPPQQPQQQLKQQPVLHREPQSKKPQQVPSIPPQLPISLSQPLHQQIPAQPQSIPQQKPLTLQQIPLKQQQQQPLLQSLQQQQQQDIRFRVNIFGTFNPLSSQGDPLTISPPEIGPIGGKKASDAYFDLHISDAKDLPPFRFYNNNNSLVKVDPATEQKRIYLMRCLPSFHTFSDLNTILSIIQAVEQKFDSPSSRQELDLGTLKPQTIDELLKYVKSRAVQGGSFFVPS